MHGDPYSIDLQNPVDWTKDENKGLRHWYLCLPHSGWHGGATLRDLCRRVNGTLTNMDPPTDWVGPRGRPGGFGAIDFDGSNDSVSMGDVNAIDGAAALTISGWVMYRTLASLKMIVSKGRIAPDAGVLIESSTGGFGDSDDMLFTPTVGAGGGFGYTTSNVLTANRWTWFCMIFDGSQSTNATRLRVLVNGIEQSLSFFETIGATVNSTYEALTLGATSDGQRSPDALIDDVRISTRALSITQAQNVFLDSRVSYQNLLNRTISSRHSPVPTAGAATLPERRFPRGVCRGILRGVA